MRPTCKECRAEGRPLSRKAPYPGPRCASHHRARLRVNRETARGRRLVEVYSITAERYEQILSIQLGACAICRRARGTTKKLSVDHDHACCASKTSCGNCVRGLLCQPCNRMLGHLRDDPEAFERAADYLRHPPAQTSPG